MGATNQIEQFLRTIRTRNRREIVVGLLLLPIVTVFAATAPLGSFVFYAFIMSLLGILFVIGMIYFVASPHGDLTSHPTDDVQHWRTEFLRQAKLLRLVPLWYILPLMPGMVLFFWLMHAPSANYFIVIVISGFTIWLNLRAASKLEQEADTLK
jgi:hypothetical protein